ncbi:MAG: hypothetical protein NT062_23415 [Proteobacteria bacterium]|nr:hypothetical protein [Pseudomonadota bacterium]
MRGSPLVLVVASVGCATPTSPSFLAETALVVDTSDGTKVKGFDFQLEFATSEMRMPNRLVYRGTELLSPADGGGNEVTEHGIGLALYPAYAIVAPEFFGTTAASVGNSNPTSTLTTELAGPAVVRQRVDWSLDFACEGTQHAMGTSYFTTFPSGEIHHRVDATYAVNGLRTVTPGTCGRGSSGHLNAVSYWVFTAPQSANRTADDTRLPVDGDPRACASWDATHTVGVDLGTELTRFHANDTNSFIASYPGEDGGDMVSGQPHKATTRIQLSAQPQCAAATARFDRPTLTIGGKPIGPDADGIYRDDTPHAAAISITARDGKMPGGFAVSLDLGGVDHVKVTRDGPTEATDHDWYLAQPDGDRVIVYLRDELPGDQTITIEPLD